MEHRRLTRHELIYYLEVRDRATGEPLGRVVDLNTEGLKLISRQPIPVEREYDLQILTPQPIAGRCEVDVQARSLWTRPDVNPEFLVAGFRFLPVGADQESLIAQLIHRYQFDRQHS